MAPICTNRSWFVLLPLLLSLLTAAADNAAAGRACRAKVGTGSCDAAVASRSLPRVAMLQTQTLHGTAMLMEHDMDSTNRASDAGEMNVDVGGVTHKTPSVKGKPGKKARASDEDDSRTDSDESTNNRELIDEDETFTGAVGDTEEDVAGEDTSANADGSNEVGADIGEVFKKKSSSKDKAAKKTKVSHEDGSVADYDEGANEEVADKGEALSDTGVKAEEEEAGEDTSASKDGSNQMDADLGEASIKKSSGKSKPSKKANKSDEDGAFADYDEGANNKEVADDGESFADAGGEAKEEEAGGDTSAGKDGSNEMDANVGEATMKKSSRKSEPVKKAKPFDEDVAYADVDEGTDMADEDETSADAAGLSKVEEAVEDTASANKDGSSDEVDKSDDIGEDVGEEKADKDKSVHKAGRYVEDDQDEEAAEDKVMSSDEVENFADSGEESSGDEADKSIIGIKSKHGDHEETLADPSQETWDKKDGKSKLVSKARSVDDSDNFADGEEEASKEEAGETTSAEMDNLEEEDGKDTLARKASSLSAKAFDSMASSSIHGDQEHKDGHKKGGKKKDDAGIASSRKGEAKTKKNEKVSKQLMPKKASGDRDGDVLAHDEAIKDRSGKARKGSDRESDSAAGQDESAASGALDDEDVVVAAELEEGHRKGNRKHADITPKSDAKKPGRMAARKATKHQSYASRLFRTLLLEAKKEITDKSVKQAP